MRNLILLGCIYGSQDLQVISLRFGVILQTVKQGTTVYENGGGDKESNVLPCPLPSSYPTPPHPTHSRQPHHFPLVNCISQNVHFGFTNQQTTVYILVI